MKLWKNNRVDQEYELTEKEILDKFFEAKYFQDYSLGMIINLERVFRLFLTSEDPYGLSSIMEEPDIQKCLTILFKDPRRHV